MLPNACSVLHPLGSIPWPGPSQLVGQKGQMAAYRLHQTCMVGSGNCYNCALQREPYEAISIHLLQCILPLMKVCTCIVWFKDGCAMTAGWLCYLPSPCTLHVRVLHACMGITVQHAACPVAPYPDRREVHAGKGSFWSWNPACYCSECLACCQQASRSVLGTKTSRVRNIAVLAMHTCKDVKNGTRTPCKIVDMIKRSTMCVVYLSRLTAACACADAHV